MRIATGAVTYSELAARFGEDTAFQLMRTIEKLGTIKDNIVHMNQNTRFQRALDALNEVNSV